MSERKNKPAKPGAPARKPAVANEENAANGPNGRGSIGNLRYLVTVAGIGFLFTLPFLGVIIWLLSRRAGWLTWPETMTLFVCIALCASIALSASAVNAAGEVRVPVLGISLAGGAAIGVAIVLLLNHFVRPMPPYAVFKLTDPTAVISWQGAGFQRILKQIDGVTYVAEFKEGVDWEEFDVRTWDPSAPGLGKPQRRIVKRGETSDLTPRSQP